MRLIDADRFKKQLSAMAIKENLNIDKVSAMIKLIDSQPTAYDADKAIERLEELQQYFIYSNTDLVKLSEVIEIAKGAVKDE